MSQAGIANTKGGGTGNVQTLTGNTGGPVGPTGNNINVIAQYTNTVSGNPGTSTLTITPTSRGYPITPFVVGPATFAGYQTVQSAVNAAEAAGGGIVYIQPGTYIENVTMTQNVHLVGLVGSSGNIGFTLSGGETLPVVIQGNFTLDLTTAITTPTTQFKDICFTANAGILFSYVGSIILLESGYLTFDNCQFIAGTSPTYIFSNNGFFNINFNSSEIFETNPGSTNLITFGATPFLNFNSRNSYVNINRVTACSIPGGSFNIFTLQETYWAARIDASPGIQSFQFISEDSILDGNGINPGDPLINFGSNSGSLTASNCFVPTANGALASSTSAAASSVFRYNNCIWNNPLTIGTNGRGEFSFCEFYGGSSAAITFSSSQSASIINSVINSSNNPAIAGSGAGTLTIEGTSFANNTSIANTLTVATTGGFYPGGNMTTSGFVWTSNGPDTVPTFQSPTGAFNYTNVNHAASPYTVLSTDYYISVDCSGGTVTLRFPNAPTAKQTWIVKDRTGNASTNNISITTPGGIVTFDGQTTYTMNSNYQAINLLANTTPTYEVY